MGSLNVGLKAKDPVTVGAISFPLFTDLPSRFTPNPLKRCNRVNIRLREEDIGELEAMALAAGMPFQSFLAEIIHKYAKGNPGAY